MKMKTICIITLLMCSNLFSACNKKDTPGQESTVPVIETAKITNVSVTSAVTGGVVISDGGELIELRGVCWSVSRNPATDGSYNTDLGASVSFSSIISGLTPSTTYYVRAFAVNANGTAYGQERSFTTLAAPEGLPVIETAEVTGITKTSAISGGNVMADGGETITSRGICWGTDRNPTIENQRLEDNGQSASFTANITGLTPGTTCYVRAYATNRRGTAYGTEMSFRTRSETTSMSSRTIPQELETVPEAYSQSSNQRGTLVEFTYDTYESRTYAQKSQKLTKRAIIYLPYGYSSENKYNVFYLMHGGWGNETSPLGVPSRPNFFKNIIDNAIANGKIPPLIIVCPTYNNTSSEDSGNFSLALELNRNYHNELINDLMPVVESAYSTYAESVSTADLTASRDHRGFGGFSMGSVATWRTFQYCLDYFRYFLPMSCGTSLDEDNIFAAARNHDQSNYFVWVITGTADFAYSYDNNRVSKMRNSQYFTEADNEQNGNFAYRVKTGYSHDGRASTEYTYNGLRWFWNED